VRELLEVVWGDLKGLRGELRPIQDGKAKPAYFTTVDKAVDAAIELDQKGADVFFGVLPRTGNHSTAEGTVSESRVLWIDIDAKTFGGSKSSAFFSLARVTPQPQIVVDSGNGYHAYWLLDEPVPWHDAQQAMKGIALTAGGDRVYDQARILRLPGTRNHKTTPPNPVRLLKLDLLGRRHRFADFIDFADTAYASERPARTPRRSEVEATEGWNPSKDDAPKFPDGERNNSLARLAGIMVVRGVEPDRLVELLLHENEMRCDPPLPDKEVIQIAKSVERYRS
jgi:hypothetical protein